MFSWLSPELVWFGCGVVLIFLEFAVPGVILVFFGAGAILTSILTWAGVLPGVTGQLVVFSISSLALLFGLRKYAARFFRGESTEEQDDEYTGKIARVTRGITPGSVVGKVFFEGTDWKAESSVEIPEGSSVRITGKNNITLFVEPVQASESK
ncbi:MAG: NfeD family protein [Candidatus Sabulitectum sp.]|nr:NfeD family protein [Candidatus Sabulitectum sp.]